MYLQKRFFQALNPQGSKFFQVHAVFGKFWQNRVLSPPQLPHPPPPRPTRVGTPNLGKILDPLLRIVFNVNKQRVSHNFHRESILNKCY